MNIYVGNLSREVTEEDLRGLFEDFGQITSVNIIKDKFSGKSRGFGFVEMSEPEDGQAAIQGLNGMEFMGRDLTVNLARPRAERPRGGGGRGRERGNRREGGENRGGRNREGKGGSRGGW